MLHGYVSLRRSCVSVCNVEKTCCFKIKFTTGVIFDQRGSKFDVFHPNFGHPHSYGNSYTGEKKGPKI